MATKIVKDKTELDAEEAKLTNKDEAFICMAKDVTKYEETHDTSDPKHHTWTIRSKATGKKVTVHFYPQIDPVKQGFINADALEEK